MQYKSKIVTSAQNKPVNYYVILPLPSKFAAIKNVYIIVNTWVPKYKLSSYRDCVFLYACNTKHHSLL